MSKVSSACIPSVNRKIIIAGFLVEGWIFIALIAATALDIVSYGEVKYLHWVIPLTLPIWVLLMSNSTPHELNAKSEKRVIMAMSVTFAIFVIVALTSMLHGNI